MKNIRKGFVPACRGAELDNVTLHTIRHSSAVAMVSNGVPLEKVAQYLNRSNVAITYQTYARFAPDHLKDAAEKMRLKSWTSYKSGMLANPPILRIESLE